MLAGARARAHSQEQVEEKDNGRNIAAEQLACNFPNYGGDPQEW
jgi:hypothetical protein